MRHFATERGKSKGQFYTHVELSCTMAKVIGLVGTKDAGRDILRPGVRLGIFAAQGHAMKARTVALALWSGDGHCDRALVRMNLILHNNARQARLRRATR